MKGKIVIIGAGPTGIGAAYRLKELGYENFEVYEKNGFVGGLSASYKDDNGFYWDDGGHVLHSHYSYFDEAVNRALKEDYLMHLRESWIWTFDRFVPYPFQNNLHYLSEDKVKECVEGLIKAGEDKKESVNFEEWIYSTFGDGIARNFMIPYNNMVWVHPLSIMSKDWIAERVSVVDVEKIKKNVSEKKDDVSWGPNNKFLFPLHGGTGKLFSSMSNFFKEKIKFNMELLNVDHEKKIIYFKDGSKVKYDHLISAIPLDQFVKKASLKEFYSDLKDLKYSSLYIVGIGLKDDCPSNKCWMYFPENDSPFYRVTYFSNYSPNNVPQGHYSLMAETAYSEFKKEDKETIIERTIQGMINSKLISEDDKDKIVSKYLRGVDYGYPIPTLGRDASLRKIQSFLMEKGIYSRGRFGAWKYEVGNMDHTFMQGVEVVDKILSGKEEVTWIL